jgi:hypothetical protein
MKTISGLRGHHLNITANLNIAPMDILNDRFMHILERYIKTMLQSKQILKENKTTFFLFHAHPFLQH